MAQAWIYQDDKQVKKRGEEAASWYVGWYDPDGKKKCKSCGPGVRGKRLAGKEAERVNAQLITGTYNRPDKKTWQEFRKDYEEKIASGMEHGTKHVTLEALNHLERLINPKLVTAVKTQTLDEYIRRRRLEPGKKKGETVRAATINKELRHIRAVLRIAHEWKYLPDMPRVRMLKEAGKLPTYVTPDHFAAIFAACDVARMPRGIPGVMPPDWWRGFLVFAYMTGWRSCEILGLMREDVDLDGGFAVTRAVNNKGKRDERIKLHPVVVEHLRLVPSFDPCVFPWNHNRRTLDDEFDRIQVAAGIRLPCTKKHEHTEACHFYGFHDFRRAFATQNAQRLTADALQKLMRHKSYATTQRYINMTSQMEEAVDNQYVPDVLQTRKAT